MSTPKGSHDLRAEIFEAIKPAVDAVEDKDAAVIVINQNIQRTQQIEHSGLSTLKGVCLNRYLELYEVAAQLALKWRVLPETVLGYAYRLKLLGMHSSGYRLEEAIRANDGLFRKELIG